jgi:hypothetical protein
MRQTADRVVSGDERLTPLGRLHVLNRAGVGPHEQLLSRGVRVPQGQRCVRSTRSFVRSFRFFGLWLFLFESYCNRGLRAIQPLELSLLGLFADCSAC